MCTHAKIANEGEPHSFVVESKPACRLKQPVMVHAGMMNSGRNWVRPNEGEILSFPCLTRDMLPCLSPEQPLIARAGMVGFGQDLGATRSLASSDESGQAMEATAAAMLEADRRITDPFRPYKFWRKARHSPLIVFLSSFFLEKTAARVWNKEYARCLSSQGVDVLPRACFL